MIKPYPQPAEDILDQTFLDIRAKILEIAAAFDRIERADVSNSIETQAQWQQLQAAARILVEGTSNRAEQVQLHFSDPYEAQWEKPQPASA